MAPTIAGVFGATSITGVSWVASTLGISAVAATPVGWSIGCAAAGVAICHGVGILVRKGGEKTQKQETLKENIIEKICNYRSTFSQMPEDDQFKNIAHLLRMAYEDEEKISPEQGCYIIDQMKNNQITPRQALALCEDIVKKS